MTRTWPTGLIELADGVFAYVQEGGGLCVSNAGLIVGPEGCIVIDALFAPSMTRAFRDEIARVTDNGSLTSSAGHAGADNRRPLTRDQFYAGQPTRAY